MQTHKKICQKQFCTRKYVNNIVCPNKVHQPQLFNRCSHATVDKIFTNLFLRFSSLLLADRSQLLRSTDSMHKGQKVAQCKLLPYSNNHHQNVHIVAKFGISRQILLKSQI